MAWLVDVMLRDPKNGNRVSTTLEIVLDAPVDVDLAVAEVSERLKEVLPKLIHRAAEKNPAEPR